MEYMVKVPQDPPIVASRGPPTPPKFTHRRPSVAAGALPLQRQLVDKQNTLKNASTNPHTIVPARGPKLQQQFDQMKKMRENAERRSSWSDERSDWSESDEDKPKALDVKLLKALDVKHKRLPNAQPPKRTLDTSRARLPNAQPPENTFNPLLARLQERLEARRKSLAEDNAYEDSDWTQSDEDEPSLELEPSALTWVITPGGWKLMSREEARRHLNQSRNSPQGLPRSFSWERGKIASARAPAATHTPRRSHHDATFRHYPSL